MVQNKKNTVNIIDDLELIEVSGVGIQAQPDALASDNFVEIMCKSLEDMGGGNNMSEEKEEVKEKEVKVVEEINYEEKYKEVLKELEEIKKEDPKPEDPKTDEVDLTKEIEVLKNEIAELKKPKRQSMVLEKDTKTINKDGIREGYKKLFGF